jgi:hypothetical protein
MTLLDAFLCAAHLGGMFGLVYWRLADKRKGAEHRTEEAVNTLSAVVAVGLLALGVNFYAEPTAGGDRTASLGLLGVVAHIFLRLMMLVIFHFGRRKNSVSV